MAPPIARLETLDTMSARLVTLETALLQEQRRGALMARLLADQQLVLRQVLHQLTEDALTNDGAHLYERLQLKLATLAQIQQLRGTIPEKEDACSAST